MNKEDKSKEYSELKIRQYDKNNTIEKYGMYRAMQQCNFDGFDIQETFEEGWDEALKNQWVNVKEKQPGPNELVLCRMVSNEAIVSGYIYSDGRKWRVATLPNFEFADYGGYECDYWMKIPTIDEILEANKDVLKRLKDK